MARLSKVAKTVLSLSVPLDGRELLEQQAIQSKTTMSDLVYQLIREAFKPKRGLAKRIESKKLQIKTRLEQARIEADSQLAELDKEWSDSMQSMLLDICKKGVTTGESDKARISRWLFNRRVIGSKARNGRYCSFDRLAEGPVSFMDSLMIPDKLIAADLAAESESQFCELSELAFEYILSCFDSSLDAMYEAFNSPCNLPPAAEFGKFLKESDRLFGSDLLSKVSGTGSLAELPLVDFDPSQFQ